MSWFKRKKKLELPNGLKPLSALSDETIKEELKMVPYLLPTLSDEMMRGTALWLSLLQEEEHYQEAAESIVAEIRALDAYMESRGHCESGGVPTFFAYIYYMILWNNSIRANPDFARAMEIANLPKLPEDDNRGYA